MTYDSQRQAAQRSENLHGHKVDFVDLSKYRRPRRAESDNAA